MLGWWRRRQLRRWDDLLADYAAVAWICERLKPLERAAVAAAVEARGAHTHRLARPSPPILAALAEAMLCRSLPHGWHGTAALVNALEVRGWDRERAYLAVFTFANALDNGRIAAADVARAMRAYGGGRC